MGRLRRRRRRRSPGDDGDTDEIHRVNIRTSDQQLQLNLGRIRHLLPQQRERRRQQQQDESQRRQPRWRRFRQEANSWYADAYPENITYSQTEQVRGIKQEEMAL